MEEIKNFFKNLKVKQQNKNKRKSLKKELEKIDNETDKEIFAILNDFENKISKTFLEDGNEYVVDFEAVYNDETEEDIVKK